MTRIQMLHGFSIYQLTDTEMNSLRPKENHPSKYRVYSPNASKRGFDDPKHECDTIDECIKAIEYDVNTGGLLDEK